MTKAELFVILDELKGVDEDFDISVKVTEENQVGFLCLAAGVDPKIVELLADLGAEVHPDGVWCLDLRVDLCWNKTEDINERK